jgi:CheY-like chemotaxis protein
MASRMRCILFGARRSSLRPIDCARLVPHMTRPSVDLQPQLPPPRVLLADADIDTRELYQMWLSAHGFDVDLATSAAEVLSKVRDTPPDVVVLELMLPSTGGLHLIDRLQADESTCDALLIVLTTQAFPTTRDQVTSAGAHGFLAKPCPPRLLGEVMASLSETHSRGRQVRPSPRPDGDAERVAKLVQRTRAICERVPREPLRLRVGERVGPHRVQHVHHVSRPAK